MTPEIMADWLRRQGHRVIRTESTYWFDQGPRVFQAFPYHWVIRPTNEELIALLEKEHAIGLRYSTPLESAEGSCSYHVVYGRSSYGLIDVDPSIRGKVRKGLEACSVGPISFERYEQEGWSIERDTQHRQQRHSRKGRTSWERMIAATSGLEGFEVWGAEVEGKLAATLMFVQIDDCVDLLYQQSLRAYLPLRVNNALLYETTRALVERPGIRMIHNGLHSLDAPGSVDQFKVRLGYDLQPLRQRVMFHPRLAPLFNNGTARMLERVAGVFPKSEFIQKAEGLTRFYCNGKLPLERQSFPELLEPKREAVCSNLYGPSPLRVGLILPDNQKIQVSPASPVDLPALVNLHVTCFSEDEHFAMKLGRPFINDVYRWFITSPENLVLVAKAGNKIVGFTALSNRPYNIPMIRACKWTVLTGLLHRPWLAFRPDWMHRLAAPLLSFWSHSPKKVAQIAFTGIAKEFRGFGIGRVLKQASIQACRDWGVSSVTTGVRHDNFRAIALNEQFGFAEVPNLSSRRLVHLNLDLNTTKVFNTREGDQPLPGQSDILGGSIVAAPHRSRQPESSMEMGCRRAQMSDIPEIVRVHQEAFPNFFMTTLGPKFLQIYYRKIINYPDHVFWVKEGKDGLEGFVSGFINSAEFYKQMNKRRLTIGIVVIHRIILHPSMLLRLFASYSQVWRTIHEENSNTCELSSIAVSPRSGGKGIGQELAKVFVESVRRKATAVLLTTDAIGNDGVNAFYQKLGFILDGSYERSKGRLMNRYRFPLEASPAMDKFQDQGCIDR